MKICSKHILAVTLATVLSTAFCKAQDTLSFYEPTHDEMVEVDLNVLSNGDATTAWRLFRKVWGNRYQPNMEDIVRKASRAIARNVGVQTMVEEKFKPVTSGYQKEMGELRILGGIPALWSVRILGANLMNSTPMEPIPPQGDVGTESNEYIALEALTAMGFSDPPTKLDKNGMVNMPIDGSGLEKWKAWWRSNESHIEQRIHEINSEYIPPAIPASTAKPMESFPTSKPPLELSPPASPTPSPASIAKNPEPAKNDWMLYVGAGVALLIAGTVMMARLLKRKP